MYNNFWDTKYSTGHYEKYPWDHIVSFLMRFNSNHKSSTKPKLLEVGCGSGNNLAFAAKEGFNVYGIDISPTALTFASDLISSTNSEFSLHLGSFLSLPYQDNYFDIVIDRCSLTCVDIVEQLTAVNEILRCLKPGGLFHYSSYGFDHPSRTNSTLVASSLYTDISTGNLVNAGSLSFLKPEQVSSLFTTDWKILSFVTHSQHDQLTNSPLHQEHRVVLQKESHS